MDREGSMLTEIRQRQVTYDLTYMWNLKKKKKLTKEKKEKLIDTEQIGGLPEAGWGAGVKWVKKVKS